MYPYVLEHLCTYSCTTNDLQLYLYYNIIAYNTNMHVYFNKLQEQTTNTIFMLYILLKEPYCLLKAGVTMYGTVCMYMHLLFISCWS